MSMMAKLLLAVRVALEKSINRILVVSLSPGSEEPLLQVRAHLRKSQAIIAMGGSVSEGCRGLIVSSVKSNKCSEIQGDCSHLKFTK